MAWNCGPCSNQGDWSLEEYGGWVFRNVWVFSFWEIMGDGFLGKVWVFDFWKIMGDEF
jgi:hypothetical protein